MLHTIKIYSDFFLPPLLLLFWYKHPYVMCSCIRIFTGFPSYTLTYTPFQNNPLKIWIKSCHSYAHPPAVSHLIQSKSQSLQWSSNKTCLVLVLCWSLSLYFLPHPLYYFLQQPSHSPTSGLLACLSFAWDVLLIEFPMALTFLKSLLSSPLLVRPLLGTLLNSATLYALYSLFPYLIYFLPDIYHLLSHNMII